MGENDNVSENESENVSDSEYLPGRLASYLTTLALLSFLSSPVSSSMT